MRKKMGTNARMNPKVLGGNGANPKKGKGSNGSSAANQIKLASRGSAMKGPRY